MYADGSYKSFFAVILGLFLTFSACGQESATQSSVTGNESEEVHQEILGGDVAADAEHWNEVLGIDVGNLETSAKTLENVADNVILVAALDFDYRFIADVIMAFNKQQNKYKVEVKEYENRTSMLLDMVRGEGCDILVLNPANLNVLGSKSALEDLTPYFEKSDEVNREDLFSCIWETGMVGDKMLGIMSQFQIQGILVERGYTNGGGWTIDDYFELMEKNKDIPISCFVDEDNYMYWLLNDLAYVPHLFVDWDNRTSDYDSEAFIELIKDLKYYSSMFPNAEKMGYEHGNLAEGFYTGKYATAIINLYCGKGFLDIRT